VIKNSGNRNSGNFNSGNFNSGDRNSGGCNSGNCNPGNFNSGNFNSGNRNSGNFNSGDRNSGDCNTNSPKVRLFNHDSGWEYFCNEHNTFRRILNKYQKPLCEWISESNMSDDEKEKNESYKTTGGYLKVNESTFAGADVSKEDAEFLRATPNFDADILLECTGIDITNKKKKIVIDGKEILISKESFEEIKRHWRGVGAELLADNAPIKVQTLGEIAEEGSHEERTSMARWLAPVAHHRCCKDFKKKNL